MGSRGGRDRGGGNPGTSGRHHPYRREQEKPAGVENEKVEHKLYVGNLDHRVTEYHLIKMFSPFGKIRHEEYLWHTHGPRRGEPRGYGFVEYATREEAERAKEKMNGRLAFGRPLVVRFVEEKISAHNADAPVRQMENAKASNPASGGTAGGAGGPIGISKSAKIAAIQNKLRMIDEGRKAKSTGEKGPAGDASRPLAQENHEANGRSGGGQSSDRRGVEGSREISSRSQDRLQAAAPGLPHQSRTLLQTGQRWSAWG